MRFRAGELEFNASVAESSETSSPRTGDILRSLTIQFRAQKAAMHEQALAEARQRQAGGLFSLGEADRPEMEWRVRESTSSYVGTEPWGINHHVWHIEQVERLACERLIVGSLELEPFDYVEEASEDRIVRLAARALVSDTDLDVLSRIAGSIDVVRVGISDTPRRMVLTGYVWSETLEGLAVALALGDAREPRVTLRGLEIGSAENSIQDLLAVLHARGALGDEDLDELRRRRHAARRVSNVDTWSLST
jgi:hypothetical protein